MSTAAMPAATSVNGDPWEMEVTPSGGGGGEYVLCPPGNYAGTIVGLFDVGLQPETRQDGTATEVRKLVVVYELAKKRPDGQSFLLAERYTWSMNKKANFYAMACGLTGTTFNEGDRFDPRVILGQACMVQVTNHDSTKNGKNKTYHNIAGVAQFPEGLSTPVATREPVAWSVRQREGLPDTSWVPYVYGQSIKDMVQMSAEYKAGNVPRIETPASGGEADADIPF